MYQYINILPNEGSLDFLNTLNNPQEVVLDITPGTAKKISNLDNFLAVNITTSSFKNIKYNKYLNIFLIKLSTLDIQDLNRLDNLKVFQNHQLYIDFYIDRVTPSNLKVLKEILNKLNDLNIRVCYTYENIKDRVKFDRKISPLFQIRNYYDYQKMITNYENTFICKPQAIKIDPSTQDIYLDCNDIFLGNLNDNTIEYYLSRKLVCQEKFCSSGDAINKENNYNNFYKIFKRI